MKQTILMTVVFVLTATAIPTSAQSQTPGSEASAAYNKATTLYKAGKYDEAIDEFKTSSRHKPDFAWAHNNLGTAYADAGMYSEAVNSFKEALRLKPDFAEARRNLGIALYHLDLFEEAVVEYRWAINLKPNYEAAYSRSSPLERDISKLHFGRL